MTRRIVTIRLFIEVSCAAALILSNGLTGALNGQTLPRECKDSDVTASIAESVISEGFVGVFKLTGAQSRVSRVGQVKAFVQPAYVVLDANGDGIPDLIAMAQYAAAGVVPSSVPFSFGSVGVAAETIDAENVIAPGSPIGNAISEQASANQLFLLIIFGERDFCWRNSTPSARFAIANVVPFENFQMSAFRGDVLPASAGDSGIIPPPHLIGDAILLTSKRGRNDQIVFWTGSWFNWYPFRRPSG